MIKQYYQLTKPGIVYGNALTATAGFFLASNGAVDASLFIAMLLGLSSIIASACVFNNLLDINIDKLMSRTKNRPLVNGMITKNHAFIFATSLAMLGAILLAFYTNILTLITAIFGFLAYVFLYGYFKRKNDYGTIIGSISGATPPVIGYLAVTNNFDSAAILLFIILIFWQMPHFYAIAMYRINDYRLAGIPVLPITKGLEKTKYHSLLYVIGFLISTYGLFFYDYVGYSYLIVTGLLSLFWILIIINGLKTTDTSLWARQNFRFSLVVILALSIVISLDSILP